MTMHPGSWVSADAATSTTARMGHSTSGLEILGPPPHRSAGPMTGLRWGRRAVGSSTALALTLLALGCGTQTAVPRGPVTATPPSSSAPTPSPGTESGSWTASGDSFGVDRYKWPTTVAAAESLIKGMPTTFEGRPGQSHFSPAETGEDGEAGASASVGYGRDTGLTIAEAYITTDTEDGKPEPMTANQLLGVYFVMGYACADGTYKGTATPAEGRMGPAPTDDQPDGPVWFSCRIDGAEGDEDFSGHAVGWTSGKTAWQVLGPDADAVRSLVTTVHDAAR